MLGAAFKPDSDDVRDSPALDVAAQARRARARDVVVTDPEAIANATAEQPAATYVETAEEAVDGAELVLLLTEWQEYRRARPRRARRRSWRSRRILDGRNALDPAAWRDAGWTYRALGRGKH